MKKVILVGIILLLVVVGGLSCKSPEPVSTPVPEWPPSFYPLRDNPALAPRTTTLHTKVMGEQWFSVDYKIIVDEEELFPDAHPYDDYYAKLYFWLGDSEPGGKNGYLIKGKLEFSIPKGGGTSTSLEIVDVQIYPKERHHWDLATYLESLKSLNDVDDYFLTEELLNLAEEFRDKVFYPVVRP